MKAQFVYENLDFERGIDPREAMDIGMEGRLKNWLRKNYGITPTDPEVSLHYAVLGERLDFVKYLVIDKEVPVPDKIVNVAIQNKVDDEIILILVAKGDKNTMDYIKSKSRV